MKKIILISITLLFSVSKAEYLATFPLEIDKGGNLPNGTIKIGNNENSNPSNNDNNSYDCLFDNNDNYYYQSVDSDNNVVYEEYIYNGYQILGTNLNNAKKGQLISTSTYDGETENVYEICYDNTLTEEWVKIEEIIISENNTCTNPELDLNAAANIELTISRQGFIHPDHPEMGNYYYYEGYGPIDKFCTTKEVNYRIKHQNNITLQTTITTPKIIETVNRYKYDEEYLNCSYQKENDMFSHMVKWVTNGTNASFWFNGSEHNLLNSSVIFDDTYGSTGGGYFTRGKLMENYLGNPHYAVCTWGGW